MPFTSSGRFVLALGLLAWSVLPLRAEERILLNNGFSVDCHHRGNETDGHVKLFLDAEGTNFLEVETARIVSAEALPAANAIPSATRLPEPATSLHALIAAAGTARNIDLALLESVVRAESGGHTRAVSRTGAQGLMQLMPATAKAMGVQDSFAPDQNLRGGTAYLDQLLTRYHDNIALALAAYNAGPGAVERYHGVPPFRETRAYVTRIILEFNRRTLQNRAAALAAGTVPHS